MVTLLSVILHWFFLYIAIGIVRLTVHHWCSRLICEIAHNTAGVVNYVIIIFFCVWVWGPPLWSFLVVLQASWKQYWETDDGRERGSKIGKLKSVISFQVASAHARGCCWEIGWSTIVHRGACSRIPKDNKRSTRQWRSTFVVLAMSTSGWCGQCQIDGFCLINLAASKPLRSMTGKSANEAI